MIVSAGDLIGNYSPGDGEHGEVRSPSGVPNKTLARGRHSSMEEDQDSFKWPPIRFVHKDKGAFCTTDLKWSRGPRNGENSKLGSPSLLWLSGCGVAKGYPGCLARGSGKG
ncbi:hypothetical protein H6P81_012046 [Aristolochia fimbriata]|uniref:Uncharacterized protein n=1 Tax=Aristolochia fimbriata TaxID=158543 RepID=A0AAV7EB18_ARIFI|nr:hypothetical protein H6P81_012046 [Aristolochia fimbriata]